MSSLSAEDKPIDADTLRFIDSLIADSRQEVTFKGYADIIYTDKKLKPRIVVISNFRMYLIKNAVMGRSVRQSFLFLHLKSLSKGAKPNQLYLQFEEDGASKEFTLPPSCGGELVLEHPKIEELLKCILFSAMSVRYGRPSLQVSVPDEWLADYKAPEPDGQDGLLATYLAECDRCGIPQRIQVIDYFMTCFQIEDSLFDVRSALSFLENRESARDVLAIASSIKYSSWFSAFVCVDFPLKNEGASALATMFDVPTSFRKLVVVNAKLTNKAMSSLAATIARGLQDFEHITICSNDIGDSGVAALTEGLEASKKVPSTLSLSKTDLGVKGFKSVARLLNVNDWANLLQVLDLSDNSMGKGGTEALAIWLQNPEVRLEQLFVCRCDAELDKLFGAIKQNHKLTNMSMQLLDVSGNKMTKRALPELAAILQAVRCLNCIFLSDCHLDVKFVIEILDAVLLNPHGVSFSLDLSKNELGPKGAKEVQAMLADRVAKDPAPLMHNGAVQWLDLTENSLGNEGIATMCKALQGTSIKALKLDRNFKVGLFARADQAGDALGAFLAGTPGLLELSVAGDDNSYYLGKNLAPLLTALGSHATLAYVDVRGNRVGDEGVQLVAEALSKCRSLKGLNVDDSRMSVTGLSILHRSLKLNRTIVDFAVPVHDLDRLMKSVAKDRVRELQQVIHDIDLVMDRNEQMAMYTSSLAEDDEDKADDGDAASNPNATATVPKANAGSGGGGSMVMRSGAASKGKTKRMSVAAGTYEDMMASLQTHKTHRKMQTRAFDSSVMDALAEGDDASAAAGAGGGQRSAGEERKSFTGAEGGLPGAGGSRRQVNLHSALSVAPEP